ncbi:hypothetical protein [Henriciella marina]|uniref:hypothetical protein n=1 Tax=Henriciella marina TaxID=453851 RepID=UPI0003650489|nr:hypothetical protein [Henriciella marina]
MTASALQTASISRDAMRHGRSVALPTLPGLLLLVAAVTAQSYVNRLAQAGGEPVFYWFAMGLVVIFTGSFWSATMYRRLLPEAGTGSALTDAVRLFVANLAVYSLFFILLFLLTLFFSIFAGVLIDASGYDPAAAGQSPDEVWRSMEALSSSGAAVILYMLLVVASGALIWLGLRLFLFGPATIAERHVTIFRSWPWTSRHVARIALLWVSLQLVPWLVLSLIASLLLHAGGMATIISVYAAPPGAADALGDVEFAGLTGVAVLILAPFYWLGHGLAVALYQRLAPTRVDADMTFG